MSSKRKNRIILTSSAAIALGLIGYTIITNLLQTEPRQESVTTPVIVAYPDSGRISRMLYYSGTLLPGKTVTLISRVSGKIEHIFVKAGDFVTREQVLVQIDDEMVSYQKEQAYSMWKAANAQFARARRGVRQEELENTRALVNQAEGDLVLAAENFERTERLYKSGTIAKAKYDEAANMIKSATTSLDNAKRSLKLMEEGASEEEITMAMANADAARAQYQLAQLQFENASLQAPEVGMVARVLVDEGNLVGTSTPILVIVRIDPILVSIPLPEMHYGRFLEQQAELKVVVHSQAYPEMAGFTGIISGIAPVIDAASRTFTAEIEIPNPRYLLRPGMYVNVEIELEHRENALLLPRAAVVSRDGSDVVFVAVNGDPVHCRQLSVTTGLTNPDQVQVVSGLGPVELVVVEGNLFLEDGQEIRIKAQL